MSADPSPRPQAGGASRQLRLGLRQGIADGWAVGQDDTLADLVRSRVSGTSFFLVLVYVAMWGRYRDTVGEPPRSNRQLAQVMNVNARTVDRYRKRFDEAFPELDDPASLYDAVRSTLDPADDPEVAAVKLGAVQL